jgi:hypothetical protein
MVGWVRTVRASGAAGSTAGESRDDRTRRWPPGAPNGKVIKFRVNRNVSQVGGVPR